jgi:hypothetical protein
MTYVNPSKQFGGSKTILVSGSQTSASLGGILDTVDEMVIEEDVMPVMKGEPLWLLNEFKSWRAGPLVWWMIRLQYVGSTITSSTKGNIGDTVVANIPDADWRPKHDVFNNFQTGYVSGGASLNPAGEVRIRDANTNGTIDANHSLTINMGPYVMAGADNADSTRLAAPLVMREIPDVDDDWTIATMQSGWEHYNTSNWGPVRFRKVGLGLVQVIGLAKKTTSVSGTQAIFSLPVGYRPTGNHRKFLQAQKIAALTIAMIDVETDGDVKWTSDNGSFNNVQWLSLDILFKT